MEPQHPPSAMRLHALIGDKMYNFPPHLIGPLEWHLQAKAKSRSSNADNVPLAGVADIGADASRPGSVGGAALKYTANVTVPRCNMQGLDAILEILHAVHVAREDGDAGAVLGEHLVEGLIVSGRALVKTTTDVMWGGA